MVADCGTWILTSPGVTPDFVRIQFTSRATFFAAIIMQLYSLLSYAPYFLQTPIVELSYIAFAILVITVIITVDFILTLYPNIRKNAAIQASS